MSPLSRFILPLAYSLGLTLAAEGDWVAPTSSDARSPCPLLNTLANHNYIPHSGQNIDISTLITGMNTALNLDATAKAFFKLQGEKALTVSSTGNASTFNLNDLDTHNLIEHDGSLSRADIASGDNWSFNETIFNETKTYWTTEKISVRQAAQALAARQESAEKANGEYDLPLAQLANALGQTAMYLGVFGSYLDGNANRDYVEYFFENEKFPTELGWTRREDDDKITAVGILSMTATVSVNYLAVKLGL